MRLCAPFPSYTLLGPFDLHYPALFNFPFLLCGDFWDIRADDVYSTGLAGTKFAISNRAFFGNNHFRNQCFR